MKVLILFLIVFFSFNLALDVDFFFMEKRARFIASELSIFIEKKGFIPDRLDDVNSIFSSPTPELYCDLFSSQIEGIGQCYYSPNKDDYYLIIYGVLNSGVYSSQDNTFRKGDGLN